MDYSKYRIALIELINYIDIEDIRLFFTLNKDLYLFLSEHSTLKHISNVLHLPYVSLFRNMLFFASMNTSHMYKLALEINDLRIIRHYVTDHHKSLSVLVRYGHIDTLKFFICSVTKIPSKAVDNAIIYNHIDIVKYFVSLYMSNTIKIRIKYALIRAIKYGHINIVKYLIEDVGIEHFKYKDIIDIAVDNKHIEIVKYLSTIQSKYHLEYKDSLPYATCNGDIKMIKLLTRKFPDIEYGKSINIVARNGNYAIFKYLLKTNNTKYSKKQRRTILFDSVRGSNIDIVKYFIKYYNYKIHKDDEELVYNSLRFNNERTNLKLVKYIQRICTTISIPHDIVCQVSYNGDIQVLKYLLRNITDIDISILYDSIENAMYGDNIDIIKYILKFDHIYDFNINSIITRAIISENIDIIRYLINTYHIDDDLLIMIIEQLEDSSDYTLLDIAADANNDNLKRLIKIAKKKKQNDTLVYLKNK